MAFEAERQAMKWEAYHSSLNILEREMSLVLNYLNNVGNQAALLAGFTFSVFTTDTTVPEGSSPAVECFFILCGCLSTGCFLYVILVSTMVAVLGPTSGLKGKDGTSMRTSVESMKKYRGKVQWTFYLGVLMYVVVICWMIWFKPSNEYNYNSAIATFLIVAAAWWMFTTLRAITTDFGLRSMSDASGAVGQGVVTGTEFLRKADARGQKMELQAKGGGGKASVARRGSAPPTTHSAPPLPAAAPAAATPKPSCAASEAQAKGSRCGLRFGNKGNRM